MQAGEDRDEQGHLECERPGLGVDPDDLGLDLGRLVGEQRIEVGVAHDLGVVLERVGHDHLLLAGVSTALESERFVKLKARVASMIAPANARPNDSPNEPAAEFTPAASLTRSSSIGASV